MKTLITLAFVCLIAISLGSTIKLSEERKAEVKAFVEQCVKQENASEEDVNKIFKKDFSNPSPSMKCLGTCISEKVGVLKDGIFQEAYVLERIATYFGEEKSKTVLENCKNIKGADRCDTGYKILECFEEHKVLIGLD